MFSSLPPCTTHRTSYHYHHIVLLLILFILYCMYHHHQHHPSQLLASSFFSNHTTKCTNISITAAATAPATPAVEIYASQGFVVSCINKIVAVIIIIVVKIED